LQLFFFPGVFFPSNSVKLVFSALVDSGFHFCLASFLFCEEFCGFVFSLGNLFVEDLFLLVSHFHQFFNLSVDQSLLDGLLFFESLLLLCFFEMEQSFLFLTVLKDSALFLLLLQGKLSLQFEHIFIGLLELLSGLDHSLMSVKFSLLLSL
jgi:hypothetical protein